MITGLRIQNFKSLEDTGPLSIRPLTLLVGPNSSGKSSVLQSLLLLKQTASSKEVTTPLVTSGHYTPNLGPYPDFVFEHKADKLLTISFSFQPPLTPPKLLLEPLGLKELKEMSVKAVFGYNRRKRIYLQNAEFGLPPYKMTFDKVEGQEKHKVKFSKNGAEGPILRASVFKFYDIFLPSVSQRSKIKAPHLRLTDIFSNEVELLFENFTHYLGPLREWPERFHPAAGETPEDVGLRGEKAIDVLWLAKRKGAKELLAKTNYWLKEFGFAEKAVVKQVMENYYQMIVNPVPGIPELEVNFADIGFGASQVLPVIVEGFHADKGSTLLIEQPEIHLHPKAQANLGDLFIAVAKERKTLIVETHSEHLLSRIRRRIAEEQVKWENIAIYFFTLKEGKSHIEEIRLNELGQFEFEEWPEDFFEEDYKEASAHFEAIAKAKAGQSP